MSNIIKRNADVDARPAAPRCSRGLLILSILISVMTAGCTVQLTAPYSSDIDTAASSLQSDFLKFAANMQMIAGTPKGYYEQQSSQYSDFEARLAVIKMRSESLSGGVACGQALEAAKKAKIPMAGQIEDSVSTALSEPATSNASCITILAGLAQNNMERLRVSMNFVAIQRQNRFFVQPCSPLHRFSILSLRGRVRRHLSAPSR